MHLHLFSSVETDVHFSNEGLKKLNLAVEEGNDKSMYLVALDILPLVGNCQFHQHFPFQYVRLLHVGYEKSLISRYFPRVPKVILYTYAPER